MTTSKAEDLHDIPVLLWWCDSNGDCTRLAGPWPAQTGHNVSQLLGRQWLALLPPEDRVRLLSAMAKVPGARAASFEMIVRIADQEGAFCRYLLQAKPVHQESPEQFMWCGSLIDINSSTLVTAGSTNDALAQESESFRERLATVTLQLETAQRLTQVGSWEFNIATGKVVWSDELFRIFGLPPEAGAPDYDAQSRLFDSESWVALTEAIDRAVRTGDGYELTLTALSSDGAARTCIAKAETLRSPIHYEVERLVGTFQDVTEAQIAQENMRRLTERLQLATHAGRVGIWDWNVAQEKLVWNQTMHDIYGTQPDRFPHTYDAWRLLLHPEDRATTERLLTDAIEGRADFRTSFRIVRESTGDERQVRVDAEVFRDERGRVLRVTGVNQDITEQRAAELRLQRSEALQRGILDSAGLAVIVTDSDGFVTQINPAAERMLGYSLDELSGHTPELFHDPDEVRRRRALLERSLGRPLASDFETFVLDTEQGEVNASEWSYIRKDGSRVPVWLAVSCLRDSHEVVGYLGVAADLTQLKRVESELRSANELLAQSSEEALEASDAKSRFLATMSHEIRTPIGAITGVTYLMGRTQLSDDQAQHVATIDRSARALLAIVNDVLDLSKIEAGHLRLDASTFSLRDLMGDLRSMMDALGGDKGLELSAEVDTGTPDRVVGDRLRLMQILVNLAGNALKFTDQGHVQVAVHQAGGRLCFSVEDTGTGIPPDQVARMFEPFTQAHARSRPGGTGLGLAIVRDLVALMEGELEIDTAPGRGTRISFDIPLALGTSADAGRCGGIGCVLLVASDVAVRESFRAHARALGWEVVPAASGAEARQLVEAEGRRSTPSLLVVQEQLSDTAGSALIASLRRVSKLQGVPAIVLTSGSDRVSQATAPEMGADVLLDESFTSSSLYDAAVRAHATRGLTGLIGAVESVTSEMNRLPGVCVLVADDSELNRAIARRILELEGATVLEAADGRAVLEYAQSPDWSVDLVLMDIEMPVMDGLEATRRLRTMSSAAATPVLAVTAGAFARERERALAAGMVEFVTKPYDPELLIATIRAHVGVARGRPPGVSSRQTEAPVNPGGWPEIAGVDSAEIRDRLSSDVDLFRSLMLAFDTDLEAFESVFSSQAADDSEALRARLHRLRGTAASLAARRVADLTGQAERAIRDQDSGLLQRSMTSLSLEIQAMRRSIQDARLDRGGSSFPVEDPVPLDPTALLLAWRLLGESSLSAVGVLESLGPPLLALLGADVFSKMQHALARLDFPSVEEILRPAVERLSPDVRDPTLG